MALRSMSPTRRARTKCARHVLRPSQQSIVAVSHSSPSSQFRDPCSRQHSTRGQQQRSSLFYSCRRLDLAAGRSINSTFPLAVLRVQAAPDRHTYPEDNPRFNRSPGAARLSNMGLGTTTIKYILFFFNFAFAVSKHHNGGNALVFTFITRPPGPRLSGSRATSRCCVPRQG